MVEENDEKVARFKRLENLYQSVLTMTDEECRAFLEEACADDPQLRQEVENLLAAHPQAVDFLSIPALDREVRRRVGNSEIDDQADSHHLSLINKSINHYEIVAPVGKGGMGEVWLAEDTHLKRKVALKLLPEEFTNDAGRIRRFEQEAHAVLALNHPNIITLFDFGHTDEGYFITTEFVDGETLRSRLDKEGRLTVRESIEITLQICSALAAAHEMGIVHRDIKPENVMLRRDGYVKVLDFGLAKIEESRTFDQSTSPSSLTNPGTVMGTASYMSPEQARGYKVDARSDIFTLGAVLYEMLSGRPAFEGKTVSDVIASILKCEPPPLTDLLPDDLSHSANARLQQVIAQALIKDREARYQTIHAMSVDLRKCAENLQFHELLAHSSGTRTSRSDASTPLVEAIEPINRNYTHIRLKALVALIVLLLVVGIAVSLLVWWKPRPSLPLVPGEVAPIQTLAILPFRFIGNDRNEEYYSHGMTEGLITKLSNAHQLTVRPISAVLKYQNVNIEPDMAARELKTDAVILGSLQKVSNRLRVNVQLNRAGEAQPIWTQDFDGTDNDPFLLQDQVALRLMKELSFILTAEEKGLLARRVTTNPEAYRLYMQGRYFHNKRNPEAIQRARGFYERAIAVDDKFALAHVYLALCITNLGERGLLPGTESGQQSLSLANKAVKLDENLGIAHGLLGFFTLIYKWDPAGAEAEFRRALELDSRLSMTRQFHGVYLLACGRTEEAIAETKRAVDLDPTTLHVQSQLGRALYLGRHYEEAIMVSLEILRVDEQFIQAYVWMGQSYSQQGKHAAAISALEKAGRLDGSRFETMAALGNAYALAGKEEDARRIITKFQSHRDLLGKFYYLATIYAGLGDRVAALKLLEDAYQQRDPALITRSKLDPKLDLLRNDPGFTSLLRRIGIYEIRN